ncbi:MAG: hypothetical protein JW821_10460 [Deltaproteobacteria bacterium]|nr:hypothetical protein [Deltaproteobacteria bacterium]
MRAPLTKICGSAFRWLLAWLLAWILPAAFVPCPCRADVNAEWGGHVRGQASLSRPDKESAYRRTGTRDFIDGAGEVRLKNRLFLGDRVVMETHYEALFSSGDTRRKTAEIRRLLPESESFLAASGPPADDRRLLDLTKTLHETDGSALTHRLDRLYVKFLPKWGTLSVGRQALTWGNGLLFNPMDLFNPFSPTEIQRDYKTGDDMAVAEFSAERIGHFQFLVVPRRDPASGDVTGDCSSLAGKLHVMKEGFEFECMAAGHYEEPVLGLGASGYVKSAAWRMNAVYTFLDDHGEKEGFLGFVANMDTSWVWWEKNMYGLVEFYYSGLGDDDYAAAAGDPAVAERIERGELFTLGRWYLAGEIQVELHPLCRVFLTAITNLQDPSIILQPRMTWDVAQDIQVLLGANVHAGGAGTEFGGFTIQGTDFVQRPADSLFAWVTWYY